MERDIFIVSEDGDIAIIYVLLMLSRLDFFFWIRLFILHPSNGIAGTFKRMLCVLCNIDFP